MKEQQIERYGRDLAIKLKMEHYKFTSPARAAVPDRLVLATIPEFLRDTIAQYIRFIEYKSTTGEVTAAQRREHARLKKMGFRVDVVNSREQARDVLLGMGDPK